MSDIAKARLLFQEAGLAFPAVPHQLASRIRQQGQWLFSTRKVDVSPYALSHYVHEVEVSDVENYVLLAHSGHGVNSYALQYYLVRGVLCMFLHLGWGGAYMNAKESAAIVAECFSLADELVLKVEEPKSDRGRRLTIVASDFYGSYWSLGGKREPGNDTYVDPKTVLREALDCASGS